MYLKDPEVTEDMVCPLHVGGRVMDVTKLRPADVDLEDVAQTLAKINRFAGRTEYPYSVAQHAVLVSAILDHISPRDVLKDRLAYEGLHHDDTEAFTGDILGPMKTKLVWAPAGVNGHWLAKFSTFEQTIREVVAAKFGLDTIEPAAVKGADLYALRLEQYHLQGRTNVPLPRLDGLDVRPFLRPMHWRRAAQAYLDAHLVLMPERAVPEAAQ